MIASVRNVLRGLVESKLWPIAVALLVALIAVPVILRGEGSGSAADDLPPTAATAPPATTSTTAAPASRRARPGASTGDGRNPFRSGGGAAQAPDDGETAGAGGTAAGGSPASPDAAAPSADAPQSNPPAADPPPRGTSPAPAASVSLRFGTEKSFKTRRGLRRPAPLPSAQNPLVVVGGILQDGRTQRFRVAPAAVSAGDGVCRPSPSRCRTIDLRAGDTQFFAFPDEPLYRLDLLSVAGRTAPAPALTVGRTARAVFSASVRFGDSRTKRSGSLTAFEPLGSPGATAFEYLGVSQDRRSAVFLLGPHARLKSHNACLDGVACRVISLRPGATATVTVKTNDGWRRYGMRFVRLRPRVASTLVRATRARARTSTAGLPFLRALMRDPKTGAAIDAVRLSRRHGTVTPRLSALRP